MWAAEGGERTWLGVEGWISGAVRTGSGLFLPGLKHAADPPNGVTKEVDAAGGAVSHRERVDSARGRSLSHIRKSFCPCCSVPWGADTGGNNLRHTTILHAAGLAAVSGRIGAVWRWWEISKWAAKVALLRAAAGPRESAPLVRIRS